MKQAYVKGTDKRIVGTLEVIEGMANLSGFEGDTIDVEHVVYSGETDVFWDEQKTVERGGKPVFLDEDGTEYTADQLELREED